MTANKVEVKRQGKRWAVYVNGQLVEGGFFDRDAAERLAATLRTCVVDKREPVR
jgi:hypothetical protein